MTESKPYGWARKFQAGRSAKAREMDARRRAVRTFGKDLNTREYALWKRDPGRYDIEGIDTPEGKNPSAPDVEYIVEDKVEVPVVHLTEPLDGKPGGKCPYCGKSSWSRATMEFVPGASSAAPGAAPAATRSCSSRTWRSTGSTTPGSGPSALSPTGPSREPRGEPRRRCSM